MRGMSADGAPRGERAQQARRVLVEQLTAELAYKEDELQQIEDRIGLAKMLLRRLRLGVLAQHYGLAGFAADDYREENVGLQRSWEAFEHELQSNNEAASTSEGAATPCQDCSASSSVAEESAVSSQSCSLEPSECGDRERVDTLTNGDVVGNMGPAVCVKEELLEDSPESPMSVDASLCIPNHNPIDDDVVTQNSLSAEAVDSVALDTARLYLKKRIIVGNTSQYIDPLSRPTGDSSSHKWMVYVRGPSKEPDISHFVKAVRFFLHPSYHPNDIIFVSKPPFHLTRLGWGEFPIRIQLEFCNHQNKPVDIIHNLTLDKTHTGQQTLGAETVVDLEVSVEHPPQDEHLLPNGHDLMNVDRDNLLNKCSPLLHGASPDWSATLGEEAESEHLDTGGKCEEESSDELPDSEFPSHPLIIRHVMLPVCEPPDRVLLDHDYCVSVVVTRLAKEEGGSPEEDPAEETQSSSGSRVVKSHVTTTNLGRCLHAAVRATPLCGPPSSDFFLVAPSLAHYKSYNIARRRAAEWMRAVAVKRHVERRVKVLLLSTKQVLQWCRRNGYTPLDPAEERGPGFCKVCGCQLWSGEDSDSDSETECHESCAEMFTDEAETKGGDAAPSWRRKLSTLSSPLDLFSSVVAVQGGLQQQEEQLDQSVDVVGADPPHRAVPDDSPPKPRVPQTPELKWVQQTAAGVGVPIFPAIIDRMYAHVVEHMLFMACSRFLRALLTQAVQEVGQGAEPASNRERVLVPLHIHQAIQNLELCDFLSNHHLELAPPPPEDDHS